MENIIPLIYIVSESVIYTRQTTAIEIIILPHKKYNLIFNDKVQCIFTANFIFSFLYRFVYFSGLFGYKLYTALMERERKRKEKVKQKHQRKNKKAN